MDADDEKKLQDEFFNCGGDVVRITNFAYDLGRARGMTEAAGICADFARDLYDHARPPYDKCAAAILKARDA